MSKDEEPDENPELDICDECEDVYPIDETKIAVTQKGEQCLCDGCFAKSVIEQKISDLFNKMDDLEQDTRVSNLTPEQLERSTDEIRSLYEEQQALYKELENLKYK